MARSWNEDQIDSLSRSPPPETHAMLTRVLLVEDDALIGQDFYEAVAGAGYEVLGPVRSMAAGLYLAQVNTPMLR
jgi:hypothetical protein